MESSRWDEAVERVVETVGDGCIVRALEPGGMGLRAVAAAHRDPDMDRKLMALVGDESLEPPRGAWLRQALSTRRSLRLPDLSADTLEDAGLPLDERIGDVAVIPIAGSEAVLVALRAHATGPYGLYERRRLQALAAETGQSASQGGGTAGGLLEEVAAAIALTDRSGAITYVNQAACELAGVAADRLMGARLDAYVDPGPAPDRASFSGTEAGDHELHRPDGSTAWVSVSSRPLFDPAGKWHATVHTMVDVTARKLDEIEMRTRLDCERALAEFAELVMARDAPGSVPDRAVELLSQQFGAPLVVLVDVARDQTEVRTVAVLGALAERDFERWQGRHDLPEGSATMAALRSGEAVTVADFSADGYVRGPIARAARAGSAVCAPVAGGATCLALVRPEIAGVDGQERQALESVARILSGRWTNV